MVYTSDNASDWVTISYPPTTTTTTTTAVGTTPCEITITPDMLVTSPYSAYTSPSITTSISIVGEKEVEEKIKKARDSVDKHVDELEQDLEYLNEQRQALEQTVFNMGDRIAAQEKLIGELQVKLDSAMIKLEYLKNENKNI